MIHYALVCERGHQFESWFQDSAAYDRQVKRGLVSCPQCSSSKVEKATGANSAAGFGRRSACKPGPVRAGGNDVAAGTGVSYQA